MTTKLPASELKDIDFPDCYKKCSAGQYLGVGECESVCPFKFKEENTMIADIYWKKNNIVSGPDDPHFRTKSEGFYATLQITYKGKQVHLSVPEYEYNDDVVELLAILKSKIKGD